MSNVWLLGLLARCLSCNTSGDTGALDLNFDPGRGADDIVRAIVVEPGGSLLLGGSFRTFDTNACAGLVRLGPDGRMDTAFAPTSDGLCNALALQTNGQFLVGGRFSEIAGAARRHLARFHPGGELDVEFAPAFAPDDSVWALAVQDDGRILVGGYLSRIGDQAIRGLTRLLPGGEPDPEFSAGAGTEDGVAALAVQTDGRILVAGDFLSFDNHARAGVVRLWPDGSVDEIFDADLTGSFPRVNTTALQAEGGMLIGGRFESVQGVARYGIARLDENGRLDPLFAADGGLSEPHHEVRSIVVAQQDMIWVAGSFLRIGSTEAQHVALLGEHGDVNPEFHPCGGVAGGVTRMARQPDGQLLLVGDFSYVNHLRRPGVARLIGQSPPVHQFILQEIFLQDGVPQLRFDTTPGQRYTVEASTDLEAWGAWVSGTFSARSITLPIPVSLGEQKCFRTGATLQER